MPIWAAAIQGGTSLLSGFESNLMEKQARKMAESEKLAGRNLLQKTGSIDALMQALQEAQLKSGHKKQLAAFGGANRAIALGGDAARRDVLNQGQRMQADATQGLISSGLIGTSAGTGAASDLAGQTTAQLANIDNQLAQAYASLNLEQGQVEANQSDELAQLIGSGRSFQQQLGLTGLDYLPVKTPKSGNFIDKTFGKFF